MSSRDYLTRYFQQLGKVLARLVGLRERREYQQAMFEIDEYLTEMLYLSEEELDGLSEEEFVNKVNSNFDPKTDANRAIAELLYHKALLYNEMKNPVGLKGAVGKSLALFYEIDQKSGCFSIDIQERISELESLNKSVST